MKKANTYSGMDATNSVSKIDELKAVVSDTSGVVDVDILGLAFTVS